MCRLAAAAAAADLVEIAAGVDSVADKEFDQNLDKNKTLSITFFYDHRSLELVGGLFEKINSP